MKVNLTVHEAQHQFLTSVALNTGLVAGLGSGKSFIATLKTILKKLAFPNHRVAYYLPTVPLIKDIAFVKFPELLSQMGLEYDLNKSDKEIHIKGFGTILFRSMSNPDTIVGYEVFYSLIDEVDILSAEVMETAFNKILARNRQKGPLIDYADDGTPIYEPNRLDVVGTPEGFRFFYKRFVKEARETDKLITAETYANKHLPAEYIPMLEAQYPPNLLEAYLRGKFVNLTSGTVYKYFNRAIHDTDIEAKPKEPLKVGQDFNVGGCCSRVFVEREDVTIQVDEIVSADSYEIVKNLKTKYPDHLITIYPDASGSKGTTNATKSDIQILREAGFQIDVGASNPRVLDRVHAVNARFHQNKILINTRKCPNSTEALEQQAFTEQGEPEKFPGAATVDDWNDALGYYIVRKFPLHRPRPQVQTFRVV